MADLTLQQKYDFVVSRALIERTVAALYDSAYDMNAQVANSYWSTTPGVGITDDDYTSGELATAKILASYILNAPFTQVQRMAQKVFQTRIGATLLAEGGTSITDDNLLKLIREDVFKWLVKTGETTF